MVLYKKRFHWSGRCLQCLKPPEFLKMTNHKWRSTNCKWRSTNDKLQKTVKNDKLQMAIGKRQTEPDRSVRFRCFCWLSWLLRSCDLGQEFPYFGQNCLIGSCRISLTEDAWIVKARWEGWFYGSRRGPRSAYNCMFCCGTTFLCRECVEARWKRWFYSRRRPRNRQKHVRFGCENKIFRECVEARWKRWFYGRERGKS